MLVYGFNHAEATRSFREAARLDPNCAMCYWGEAFALGSFLNGGMTAKKAPHAHAAITHAAALADEHANDVERALINAAEVRYPADYDPDNRRPVDQAFADAMATALLVLGPTKGPEIAEQLGVAAYFLIRNNSDFEEVESPSFQSLRAS